MRVPGTRRARLIILLSLTALTATIGWLLYARARALYRNLGPLVVQELERQLGREVSIGRVDTSRPGRVVLEQVAVAAEKRLAQGALFRAPRIVIRYAWRDVIWMRTDIVGSVRRIEIEQPYLLLVREPDGRLNIQKLVKPRPGARPTTLRARILISNGRLVFRDYKASLPRLPAENELRRVDGELDYGTFPQLTALASGRVGRGRASLIRTTTSIDTESGRLLLRVYAAEADAAYWASYFTRSPAVRVLGGRANADLVVSRTGIKAPPEYVVNVAGSGLAARVARLPAPIQGAQVVAQVTPYGVKLEGAGSVAGMAVQVSGNVLDWKQPQVALSVRGDGITPERLRRVAPQVPRPPELAVLTPGRAEAWILGPASRLYATGTLMVPAARWRAERITDARVSWRFHAGMLQFDQLTAAAARGGRLSASGWLQVQPGPPRLYVKGRAENFNLAALSGTSPRSRVYGRADADFAVSGPLRDLHGGASVQLSDLFYNKARLQSARARVDYQNGVVYLRWLRASDRLGQLVAVGTIAQRGALDLQVRARGIDLSALLAPFTRTAASGTAYFAGQVGGTLRDPRMAGHLQVYAGHLGAFNTDYAEGEVLVRPNRVQTERLVLRIYPGEVTLSGSASGWQQGRPRVDMQASIQDLSLSRLLALAKTRAFAAGSLSGNLSFAGDPTQVAPRAASGQPSSPAGWRAAGSLRIDDLLVEGTNLGTATARLQTEGGRLWVRQAAVQGEALEATALGAIGLVAASPSRPGEPGESGWITKSSPIDLNFDVQKLDLAKLTARTGARVLLQGIAQVSNGTVRGRVGAPMVTARAEAAPITVNGVSFTRLGGQVTYTPERITVRDLALRENGGVIRVVQASVEPKPKLPTNGLTVDARVDAFPIQRLIRVARNSTTVGRRSPTTATQEAAAQQEATAREVETQVVQGVLSGTITARPEGTEPGGPSLITAALDAPNVTLPGYRLIPAAAQSTTPAVSEPLNVGLKLRAAYSTAGRVTLEGLTVTRDEGELEASGTLVEKGGLDAKGQKQPNGEISLRVKGTEIQMGLFGPVAPALHPLSGVGQLDLDVTGPLVSPTIQGSLDVVKLTLAGVPFSHFSVPQVLVEAPPEGGLGQIQVQNAWLQVAGSEGTGDQRLLLVDGTVPFAWEGEATGGLPRGQVPRNSPLSVAVRVPEQSLSVLTNLAKAKGANPRIAPVLAALGGLSNVSGTMSAELTLTGTRANVNTQGHFQLANAAFQPQQGQTRFEQIGVRLDFTGNRIDVAQFEGRSSDGGRFRGSGNISGLALGVGDEAPPAQVDLSLWLEDIRYRSQNLTGYFRERFRGTVRTVSTSDQDKIAPIHATGDWRTPRLDGAIQFRNTRLQLPGSLPEPQTRNVIPVANPNFNLVLILGQDVWIETPQMRMQLAGRVPIRGTMASPNVHGTLVVERGQLIFPTARFRVEGTVEVAYVSGQAEGTAPMRVDLTATTRLRGMNPNTRQRQRYEVTMQIRGPLTADAYAAGLGANVARPSRERLTIETRSDPVLSQQEILALIGRQSAVETVFRGGGNTQDVLRSEIENSLIAWGAPAVFTPLETAIEDWLGLEEFTIDFALREPTQLRITRQITGPFFATATYSLNAFGTGPGSLHSDTATPTDQNLYTLELYYRISERFRAGYRFEEPSGNRVLQLNGTFRF